ncbi:MAG: hypothetical protein GXP55_12665 [Deltaproteobacteria bacterium]|nr:hypothetical protein [Deltaproteobacteria bacterium]
MSEPHPTVTAPGKLMLSGEYAVLEGAPALVAAVDARALISLGPDDADQPARPTPEADAARSLAEAELGAVEGRLRVDVSALRSDGGTQKLGLGSSAAAAAGAAACVALAHGLDLDAERRRVLRWALAGHRAVAPEGSGADVAACVLGGVVRFVRSKHESARRLDWPDGLELRVVWTGVEARTSDFIQRVRAFESRDAVHFEALINRLSNEAERFADAFERGSPAPIVEQVGRYGHAMEALGRAADAPIVERTLRHVAALAREAGGAAKPSGAGGGDVAIAFFQSVNAAEDFERRCQASEMAILPLRIDSSGVAAEG